MYTYVSLSIWGSKLDTKIDIYIYISSINHSEIGVFCMPQLRVHGGITLPPAARARRCSASGWAWCRS